MREILDFLMTALHFSANKGSLRLFLNVFLSILICFLIGVFEDFEYFVILEIVNILAIFEIFKKSKMSRFLDVLFFCYCVWSNHQVKCSEIAVKLQLTYNLVWCIVSGFLQ